MSLIKQLWLTILVLLLLTFGGSLFIGVTTSRHYIEQEVRIKNTDNAQALALTMSQFDKDPVTIGLLMAAQFDTGHYRLIELTAPDGTVIDRREGNGQVADVPAWFVELVSFEVPPGEAVVQDGWRQYGTLTLQSQHSFAYHSLWHSTLGLLGWFTLAGVISLALAAWIVHTIRRPLDNVVTQANDIGHRRFTISPEPHTRELRGVVQAMNRLSGSVRGMLQQESERLDVLRRRLQHDGVTGVLDRHAFLNQLKIHLERDDQRANGTLALIRVGQLGALNEKLGHVETDTLLKTLAQSLDQLGKTHGQGVAGRLGGSDFALLIPGVQDPTNVSGELSQCLEAIRRGHPQASIALPSALIGYAPADLSHELLASLDGALASAEGQGNLGQQIVTEAQRKPLYGNHAEWRSALEEACRKASI